MPPANSRGSGIRIVRIRRGLRDHGRGRAAGGIQRHAHDTAVTPAAGDERARRRARRRRGRRASPPATGPPSGTNVDSPVRRNARTVPASSSAAYTTSSVGCAREPRRRAVGRRPRRPPKRSCPPARASSGAPASSTPIPDAEPSPSAVYPPSQKRISRRGRGARSPRRARRRRRSPRCGCRSSPRGPARSPARPAAARRTCAHP